MAFVHLRTHTEFSVLDGTLRIDDAVAMAARDAQPALAVTDINNLFGAVKHYTKSRKKGVQPIVGADVWLSPLPAAVDAGPSRLLLLVKNHTGYLNLCQLLSMAWLNPSVQGQACVPQEALASHAEGLIALSGAEMGAVGSALLAGDLERARACARHLSQVFEGRFYLELQRAGLAGQEACLRASVHLAAELDLPVVATHPVQFATPDDFEAHEARVCVAEGEILTNARRIKRFGREQYFKTSAQMQALFADLPAALANSVQIARQCHLNLTLGKPQLPNFPTPILDDGQPMPMEAYFRQLSHEGLQERLVQLFPDEKQREAQRATYVDRLDFEIGTILKMGFPGYFLIVADFINWAKSHGCPVGPGRGSGAGSLVAYALKITDLDPLRYNLLFERFLNPERVSMPDFDIDFCQSNRDRVIDYVKDKYGREAVSQIATFGTMAAKAALRDVGRVLGMSYGHVDSVAKLVPSPPGKAVTLARPGDKPDPGLIYARVEAPELEQRERQEEEVAELLSLAERVEGTVRNVGMHAGGVLIAPGRITDFCPLYMQPGSDSAVSQFDKDDVEAIGLVKFDFLGLATLTILEQAKDFIRARRPGQENFAFERLPLDDRASYSLMSEGKTVAVFQLESSGMQRMLRDARPSVFEDIIALVALYRPGPMDLIPSFCARKHGREDVEYPHPLMREVLEETYGIMVYQEQVMQVAQRLGGYSLGGADLLRRAMGKKKLEEMVAHRASFAAGAAANGIDEPRANEIFDLMERFAGYGFNKSHAAAYALLAYHTAYLKAHYLAEFTAANMTVAMDDTDKLKIFHDDAVQMGLRFEPPDINLGGVRFEPVTDKAVRYGLGAIKGTGQSAIEAIVAEREKGGAFESLFDFCARVDRSRVNKRVVEALVRAGAFDRIEHDRARLQASIGLAFEFADAQAAHAHQGGLFDMMEDGHGASDQEPPLVDVAPWRTRERLQQEKLALGFYFSGHLFDDAAHEVRQFVKTPIAQAQESREPVLLAGIVSGMRLVNGQRGRVAIFRLDDGSEGIETVVPDELLQVCQDLLREDELLVVQGKVQPDRFSGGVRFNALQLWDLPAARCQFARGLLLSLDRRPLPDLAALIASHPPKRIATEAGVLELGLPLQLSLLCGASGRGAKGRMDLGPSSRLWPSEEAMQKLKDHVGAQPQPLYDGLWRSLNS